MYTQFPQNTDGNGGKEKRETRESGKNNKVRGVGVCRRAEKKETVRVAGAKHIAACLFYPEA